MEAITISGNLAADCEPKTDKKGHSYIRFIVACESKDVLGKPRTNNYRCFCYNTQFENLKKGDFVVVSGSFNVNEYKGKISFDIYVQQIASTKQ